MSILEGMLLDVLRLCFQEKFAVSRQSVPCKDVDSTSGSTSWSICRSGKTLLFSQVTRLDAGTMVWGRVGSARRARQARYPHVP